MPAFARQGFLHFRRYAEPDVQAVSMFLNHHSKNVLPHYATIPISLLGNSVLSFAALLGVVVGVCLPGGLSTSSEPARRHVLSALRLPSR